MLTRCKEIMRDVCTDFEAELKEFSGEQDHVHLFAHYPPKVQLSKLVNSLKVLSRRFWSGSYVAGSCGGAPLTIVKQYIEQQQRPVT